MTTLSVSLYPVNEGKLYRSEDGIVCFPVNGAITVIGHDIYNTKIVSPIDSTDTIKSLVDIGFSIDDSLARKYQGNGGLKASNIVVDLGFIRHKNLDPASLTSIVFNYIVENSSSENLSLDVLPIKLQKELNPRIESIKLTAELKKITASLENIRLKLCVRNEDKQLGFDSRHDSKIKKIQKKINELILDIPSDFS